MRYRPEPMAGTSGAKAVHPQTGRQAAISGDEPIVRGPHDLGWGLEEWASARREPWHCATQLAQRQVRLDHPRLTMPFPRSHEGGDELVERILVHLGYPSAQARGAFVARHPDPSRGVSSPSWLNGKPGVALHPDRWDYGTIAHEAAHHMKKWENAEAVNEDTGDQGTHGRQWAGHYARALDRLSKGAGDDFLAHHQRYHDMIREQLRYFRPSDLDVAARRLPPLKGRGDPVIYERHAAATDFHAPGQQPREYGGYGGVRPPAVRPQRVPSRDSGAELER